MKTIKNLLHRIGITPLTGDVVSLHRGSLKVLPPKEVSSLKVALMDAIKSKELDCKLKLLPDVSVFNIKLSTFNPLLFIHGLQTRFGSTKKLVRGRNRSLNRYLIFQHWRLVQAKRNENPTLYWVIAMTLITRSHSYLIGSVHHLNKNIPRFFNKDRLTQLLEKVNKMRGQLSKENPFHKTLRKGYLSKTVFPTLLKHYRTYLPKGDTFRPLGVPTWTWRVFTNMWLTMLNGSYTVGDYQQGFVPRRGTLTAWKKMTSEVLESRNIYEIDFKGFFPSVNPSLVSLFLKERAGLPKELADYLLDLGTSYPDVKNLDESKLDETPALFKAELDAVNLLTMSGIPAIPKTLPEFLFDSKGIYKGKVLAPMFEFIQANGLDLLVELMSEDLEYTKSYILQNFFAVCYEYYQVQSALFESFAPNSAVSQIPTIFKELEGTIGKEALYKVMKEPQVTGLPQGSPLSPFLSILLLEYAYGDMKARFPNVNWLFYADDGIFYSNNTEEFQQFCTSLNTYLEKLGIEVATHKSVISKVNGEWLTPQIKFLGIIFEPTTGKLYSSTRSGRSLLYHFAELSLQSESLIGYRNSFGAMISIMLKGLLNNKDLLNYFISLGILQSNGNKLSLRRVTSLIKRTLNSSQGVYANATKYLGLLEKYRIGKFYRYAKVLVKILKVPEIKTFKFSNFFSGPFGGLIQSRMYYGSETVKGFSTDSGAQSFSLTKYRGKKDQYNGSLAQIIQSKIPEYLNIFNCSSYATHEMVILSQYLCGQRESFNLLKKGPITRNIETAKAFLEGRHT